MSVFFQIILINLAVSCDNVGVIAIDVYKRQEYNPVGSYVREFELEEGLAGKRVCVSFEGVEQAMYLWLNGRFVGYSEDSFTPVSYTHLDVYKRQA